MICSQTPLYFAKKQTSDSNDSKRTECAWKVVFLKKRWEWSQFIIIHHSAVYLDVNVSVSLSSIRTTLTTHAFQNCSNAQRKKKKYILNQKVIEKILFLFCRLIEMAGQAVNWKSGCRKNLWTTSFLFPRFFLAPHKNQRFTAACVCVYLATKESCSFGPRCHTLPTRDRNILSKTCHELPRQLFLPPPQSTQSSDFSWAAFFTKVQTLSKYYVYLLSFPRNKICNFCFRDFKKLIIQYTTKC